MNKETEETNELKAEAIMEFVDIQIGAFDSGFVDTCQVSLYSLRRFAQLHVMDNYNIETESITEKWGEELASSCRSYDEGPLDNKPSNIPLNLLLK